MKRNANIHIKNQVNIIPGRVILLEVECDSVNYCLVNIYSPNNDDVDDFLIMAGDWNTVLNNDIDKLGGAQNHANHKSQEFIDNIVSDYGLSDIFR